MKLPVVCAALFAVLFLQVVLSEEIRSRMGVIERLKAKFCNCPGGSSSGGSLVPDVNMGQFIKDAQSIIQTAQLGSSSQLPDYPGKQHANGIITPFLSASSSNQQWQSGSSHTSNQQSGSGGSGTGAWSGTSTAGGSSAGSSSSTWSSSGGDVWNHGSGGSTSSGCGCHHGGSTGSSTSSGVGGVPVGGGAPVGGGTPVGGGAPIGGGAPVGGSHSSGGDPLK